MSVFSLIKSRVSILDVVNEYTTLKKAGTYWKSRCPFHHEKTGSFTVSPHKEIFYCFGCHAGGDVISFIAKVENCSQHEAVQFLADRYNIDLPDQELSFEQHAQQKKQYFDICTAVADWCHTQLTKSPAAQEYLKKRHIDAAMIKQFHIGFFSGGLKAIKLLLAAMKDEQILADDLLEVHILSQGKSVLFSPFEDRIIFPIADHMGRFCAFGARTFKLNDTRPKYYNSRENDYFQKGSLLFGLDSAKQAIQKTGRALLVEGYTDCIAMVQHGYLETVATLGTACTINHLKLLSRYAPYLYVLYDNDTAGEQAILRLTELCWQANMELKVVQLPTGQDPASYLQAGNSLESRIAHAKDIFTFFIEHLGQGFSTAPLHEKMSTIRKLLEVIALIQDPLKQNLLLQTATQRFGVPFETLKQQLKLPASPAPSIPEIEKEPVGKEIQLGSLEKRIFCAILNNIELFDPQNDNYVIECLADSLQEIVKKVVISRESSNGSFAFDQFFDTLGQDDKKIVSKVLLEYDEPMNPRAYKELMVQFQKKQWKQIVQTISAQLTQANKSNDTQRVQQLLHDYHQLKQKIVPALAHNSFEEGTS